MSSNLTLSAKILLPRSLLFILLTLSPRLHATAFVTLSELTASCTDNLIVDARLESLYATKSSLEELLGEYDEGIFNQHSPSVHGWGHRLTRRVGHGWLYRGVSISAADLARITERGFELSKVTFGGTGVFVDVMPEVAIEYGYKKLVAPKLAVVFILDPAFVRRGFNSRQATEDIPPEGIVGVAILDPRRGRRFPFQLFPARLDSCRPVLDR